MPRLSARTKRNTFFSLQEKDVTFCLLVFFYTGPDYFIPSIRFLQLPPRSPSLPPVLPGDAFKKPRTEMKSKKSGFFCLLSPKPIIYNRITTDSDGNNISFSVKYFRMADRSPASRYIQHLPSWGSQRLSRPTRMGH